MDSEAMISLVIPVYNEEANLRHLLERLRSVMPKMGKSYEIIFVDDGSRDNTRAFGSWGCSGLPGINPQSKPKEVQAQGLAIAIIG